MSDRQDVLKQLWAVAQADVASVVSVEDGEVAFTDTKAWPEEARLAVAGVEKTGGNIKIKFYDKLKALELLGKHLGLFEKGVEEKPEEESLLQNLLTQICKDEEEKG